MDLITLEEYKESQQINSSTNDVRIESLIDSVSQLVKTYCGHSIIDYYETYKTEVFSVTWNTCNVQLTETHIKNISCVEVRSTVGGEYLTLDENEYYAEPMSDMLVRTNGFGTALWPQGPGSVRVTYTAGYESTPADLRLAIIDLITYYLKDEHKQRRTLSGATVDNQGTSSQYKNVGFPDHIKRILDLYKNFL